MDYEVFLNIQKIKPKEIISINTVPDKIIVCLHLPQYKIIKIIKWYEKYNNIIKKTEEAEYV